jgi:glycosyltransferase involved in cell wall biosynthesis
MTVPIRSRRLWAPADPNGGTWSQLVNARPLIVHGWRSGGFPVGSAGVIGPLIRDRPATFLIMPSSSLEPKRSRFSLIVAAKAFRADLPQHQLIFLCNTDRETEGMLAADLNATTINQNCLFNEEIYTPMPEIQPDLDAVYIARLSPQKRHQLAVAIKRLVLVYHYSAADFTPAEFHAVHARYRSLLPSAHFVNELTPDGCKTISAPEVNRILARSRVGLCLSAFEGAMRASIEYLSAGLPIVSTRSIGGRDRFFDDEFCLIVEDDPQQIREAVDALIARRIPRQYIREKTLSKVYKERTRYINLVQDIIDRDGGHVRFAEHLETLLRDRGIFCWRSMTEFSETVLRSI